MDFGLGSLDLIRIRALKKSRVGSFQQNRMHNSAFNQENTQFSDFYFLIRIFGSAHKNVNIQNTLVTVCPRSLDPFYVVAYYIKLAKPSRTDGTLRSVSSFWIGMSKPPS